MNTQAQRTDVVFERGILAVGRSVCVVARAGRAGTELVRAEDVGLGTRAWSAKARGSGYVNEVSRYLGFRLR